MEIGTVSEDPESRSFGVRYIMIGHFVYFMDPHLNNTKVAMP